MAGPRIALRAKRRLASAWAPVEAQRIGRRDRRRPARRREPGGEAAEQTAIAKLREAFGDAYEFRSVDAVGPRVSGELVQSGTLGVVVAILAVLTYLWFRFEWQFAVGAIIGTMHDLLLTVGFFCVTQLEFNQTSIAAILTIVGYSLNETVVVLDRIREVMRKYKKLSTAEIVDMSVNAVLPRTIMTATTVFLALLALFFLGGTCHPLVLGRDDLGHFRRDLFLDLHLLADADLSRRARRYARQAGGNRNASYRQGEGVNAAPARYEGFVPGRHPIDAYGAGGFKFAGMGHVGSILATPRGIAAIDAKSSAKSPTPRWRRCSMRWPARPARSNSSSSARARGWRCCRPCFPAGCARRASGSS